MQDKRQLLSILLLIIIAISAFAAGYFAHEYLNLSQQDLPILAEARQIMERHALIDIPNERELEYGMIRGMLAELQDPYTRFVEPVQTELTSDNLEGSYGGIGATLDRDPQNFIILHPFPESPAADAGILDGDRLILVEEINIIPEISTDEVVAALRGPVGDPVSLSIARPPGYETIDFEITRQAIPLPSVTWYSAPADPKVGIITVNLIAASTADEIEKAIGELRAQDAEFYALDLRGNGGGLVDAGISIARLFLSAGDILHEQYRDKPIKTYSVDEVGSQANIPLVVLVDANTASAAEIVAGALQAQERAIIIGQPTYGKDSIQLAFDLSDSSSLHVTAAKWWLPGLELDIAENGLQPDVITPVSENESDLSLAAAIEYFSSHK
jgi:carboxyl-terminal processing protease